MNPTRSDLPAKAAVEPEYLSRAAGIDTGPGDDATDRALILFHAGDEFDPPLLGWVLFRVDMPWLAGRELPAIAVRHVWSNRVRSSRLTPPEFEPSEADPARGRLRFSLYWNCEALGGGGWDTYIASYVDASLLIPGESAQLLAPGETQLASDESRYRVVETLCHPGRLPAHGTHVGYVE